MIDMNYKQDDVFAFNIKLSEISNQEKNHNIDLFGNKYKIYATRKFILVNNGLLPIFIKKLRIDKSECAAFGF